MPDIDLQRHLLFIGIKNRYINPKNQETVQHLIARLMTEYPNVFPSSLKISYTIHQMKTQGLITTVPHYDKAELTKCIDQLRQEHPKADHKRILKECRRRVGYTEVILATDTGVVEYCEHAKKYIKHPTTKTNKIILEACKQYQPQPEPAF